MQLPDGNFFQVTINSKKLLSSIQQLYQRLTNQDMKIQKISNMINHIDKEIMQKISRKLYDQHIECQKNKKENNQQIHCFNLFIKDHEKKNHQQIQDLQKQINVLRQKITSTKQEILENTSIRISYFQKKIQNTISSQQLDIFQKEENMKIDLKLKAITKKHAQDLKILQGKITNNLILNQNQCQKQQMEEGDETSRMNVTFSQFPRRKARSQTRKREKIQRMGTICQDTGEVQMFMSKITQLESKLNSKQNQSNKVDTSISDKRGRQVTKQIMQKINKITDQLSVKLPEFEQKMMKINNRYEIINQHVGILSRKIEKERTAFNEISYHLKTIDDNKIEEKTIQNIKTSIKLLAKQLEEHVNKKVDHQYLEKQIHRINQQSSKAFYMIDEKCDKTEVRKGLSFLEDKIKNLIIVVADQKNLVKDSAIKRMQAKCLSCDKQIESSTSEAIQTINKSMRPTASSNNLTGRFSTSQLRKRIRVVHGSIVSQDI